MNTFSSAGLTVAVVIAVAGGLFVAQGRHLRRLRAEPAVQLTRHVVVPQGGKPTLPPSLASSAAAGSEGSASAAPADGARLVETMVGALESQRPELERAADGAAADLWADRLGTLLDLSPVGVGTLREFVQELMAEARRASAASLTDVPSRSPAVADLEARLAEYLSAHFGEEKADVFRAAERARQEASVEYEVGQAVHAVSQVVDLSPAQKDALFASFSATARGRMSLFRLGRLNSQFTYSWDEGPKVEQAAAIARTVLTPEQIALYEKTHDSEARSRQREMQTALHVMRDVFQQAVEAASGTATSPR